MTTLANQWALITGGSSGIGLAIARQLVMEGVHVALLARRQELLISAQNELEALKVLPNQIIHTITADVADRDELIGHLELFQNEFGTPDYLINSAGITYPGKFHTLSYDVIESLMTVNYLGTVYTTRALIPGMLARGSGHVVNISSVAGFIGTYGYSAYGASKYAVRGFSDAIRAEYRPRGIKVSVVFPPDTLTPQLEFEKDLKPAITRELSDTAGLMQADEVARIIWKDVKRGNYVILPGFNSKLLYFLVNLLGNFTYPVMDFMINNAIRSITKRWK
jgi:3-dehydrosphinganine reductase